MTKILVTGANGQMGSELRDLVKDHASIQTYNHAFTFIDIENLDLTNKSQVENYFNTNSFDWLINCAAYTAVDKAEEEEELAYKVNADAVRNLAEQSKKHGFKLIHISTDFVFDGSKNTPYTEEDEPNPINVYGKSKLAGERALQQILDDHIIIRTSWLYSSYGSNFVKTMLRLSKERDKLKVIYDQIGTPTYAKDLAEVVLKFIAERPDAKGIFHFSNEGVASWYDFANAIIGLSENGKCKVYPLRTFEYPIPAKRPQYSVMDKKKLSKNIDFNIPNWWHSVRDCLIKIDKNI